MTSHPLPTQRRRCRVLALGLSPWRASVTGRQKAAAPRHHGLGIHAAEIRLLLGEEGQRLQILFTTIAKAPSGTCNTMDHCASSATAAPQGKPRLVFSHGQRAKACAEKLHQIQHCA